MTKINTPDYIEWLAIPAWTLKQSYLLLHGKDPEDEIHNPVFTNNHNILQQMTAIGSVGCGKPSVAT